MDNQAARRRIDRLTAPDYLHGLEDRPVNEVRAMRDECRDEEGRLSYARRVLQGQLDVARSEAARRSGGEESGSLLAQLPKILADPPSDSPRDVRPITFRIPGVSGKRIGDLDAPGVALSQLPDLSDAELASLIGRLSEQEQQISQQRRIVLDHLDRLQVELVRRYRNGEIAIDELVTSPGSPDSPGGAQATD